MEDFQNKIVPGVTHWQSPNFFAFFPANSGAPSLLGDLLSGGLGIQGMLWLTSPACTELEMLVTDWLAQLLQLPERFLSNTKIGGGVIQGTASEALLVCLISGRDRTLDRIEKETGTRPLEKVVVYCSDQTHSSGKKGANIAGILSDNCRQLSTLHSEGSMRAADLIQAVEEDRAKGLHPSFVCVTIFFPYFCCILVVNRVSLFPILPSL